MLTLTDLHFHYQDDPVLSNIGFHLSSGELLHLKGANGSGKTTLLKLVAGLYQPTQGQIQWHNPPIEICFIGHKPGINFSLTVRENCYYDLECRLNPNELDDLVACFGLSPHLDKLSGLLSAGQKRQVSLLRLWMTQAKLWLLDEPFTALDEGATQILMKKISDHRQKGGSLILTSHLALPLKATEYQEYAL